MKRILTVLLLSIGLFIGLFSSAEASEQPSWKEGERLSFKVYFWLMKAGEAEILFKPEPSTGLYRFTGRAWTDTSMFKLRDRVSVVGEHQEGFPYKSAYYNVRLNEKDYRANKDVKYFHAKGEAHYKNVHAGQKEVDVYKIDAGTRDMISALYYLRDSVEEINVGDVYDVPVFDVNTAYTMKLKVLGRKKINTVLGKRYAWHVNPVLVKKDGEVGKKKDRWHLWVSDDKERLPLKINVKLKFGSFKAELKHVGKPSDGSRAPRSLPEYGDIMMNDAPKVKIPDHANPVHD